MVHRLKILKQYLIDIAIGIKTFEIRFNDRDYQVGDVLHFVCDEVPFYSFYLVTYVLKDCEKFGLMNGYCILGIKPFGEHK